MPPGSLTARRACGWFRQTQPLVPAGPAVGSGRLCRSLRPRLLLLEAEPLWAEARATVGSDRGPLWRRALNCRRGEVRRRGCPGRVWGWAPAQPGLLRSRVGALHGLEPTWGADSCFCALPGGQGGAHGGDPRRRSFRGLSDGPRDLSRGVGQGISGGEIGPSPWGGDRCSSDNQVREGRACPYPHLILLQIARDFDLRGFLAHLRSASALGWMLAPSRSGTLRVL